MSLKIHPKRKRRIYLSEWQKHNNLTQQQLADRLRCEVMTVSRWELQKTAISTDALAALVEALGADWMEPEDLFHHPDHPTANQLLRGQPQDVIDQVKKIIKAISR